MSDIPYYERFLSTPLLDYLASISRPISGIQGLTEVGRGSESSDALQFLCKLYDGLKDELSEVLESRGIARKLIDTRMKSKLADELLPFDIPDDRKGTSKPVAPIPDYLKGPHVTLFGPPGDAKLSVNAMNSFHRKLPGEPAIVSELLKFSPIAPMWGADDEDSKTPLRSDLNLAAENLSQCFDGTLDFTDQKSKKHYRLEKEKLALPIKRIPGLALPCAFLFFRGNPVPLHLYDFALHMYRHHKNPKALTFYIPKLETKEEAAYIHSMVAKVENEIQKIHPAYRPGTVRLLIVLENPRAIFQVNEIMDALHPYFAGASLGWHDFLSSTARVFKEDSTYRIPVKADPEIVIKYIKASHEFLSDTVGSRGGIAIGGMYGVLPTETDLKSPSFQVAIKGFIKDVVAQMRRNLTGFWVAHPDFVRLGIALVEGWRQHQSGNKEPLQRMVKGLLDEKYHSEVLSFIAGPDVFGLDRVDPLYPKSLIAADLKESTFIANNNPEEIRYNVFQALQYITDWLSGNGCVALPSTIEGVPVRVMDDLATAERSRWEIWHEIHHGRFSVENLVKIVQEELLFIRKDLSDGKKIVQVKWDARTEKWYAIAPKIFLKLSTDRSPNEFASELLLPFTIDSVRSAENPWAEVNKISTKFSIDPYVERLFNYFEMCGSLKFAVPMAKGLAADLGLAEKLIRGFTQSDVIDAASFHGDIGQKKATLDRVAASEQAGVTADQDLIKLVASYREKFGMKFLISAKGKSSSEILERLKERMKGTPEDELENAKEALWEITRKRFNDPLPVQLEKALHSNRVNSATIAIAAGIGCHQTVTLNTTPETLFEYASLSKTLSTAYALEYFQRQRIPLETPVNTLLEKCKSTFRLKPPEWGDRVQLKHLMNHTALNMHYVKGVPADKPLPPVIQYLDSVRVITEPGTKFTYSGGGFLVLEHLMEGQIRDPRFNPGSGSFAKGYLADGTEVSGGRKNFPAFAAGVCGTSQSLLQFLSDLTNAFHSIDGCGGISHDTAVQMLHGRDLGSVEFMGAKMGLGVFTLEGGENRFAIHQGANDGFRSLFVYCYDGPDLHKGFVILCNGDTNGIGFVVEAAQLILERLQIRGMDFKKFGKLFDAKSVPAEQVVNQAYKELLFSAFQPDLPEAPPQKGPLDPLSQRNLAVSSTILSVSNQGFGRAENLISSYLPTFDPDAYGRQGKIMDSWETVRHNPEPFDWMILQLKTPSKIRMVSFSTQFHLGNHAPYVSLEGKKGSDWVEIVPKTELKGHAQLHAVSKNPETLLETLRVRMYPDGGLTRLGIYAESVEGVEIGKSIPFKEKIPTSKRLSVPIYAPSEERTTKNWNRVQKGKEIDVASLAFGGKITAVSNEHYGPSIQAISPYEPIHMFDGFETARSRAADHSEFFVIDLLKPSRIHRFEVDFTFFRNNNPREISIDGFSRGKKVTLIPNTAVKAYAGNTLVLMPESEALVSQLQVTVYPDGGLNRFRAFSRKS